MRSPIALMLLYLQCVVSHKRAVAARAIMMPNVSGKGSPLLRLLQAIARRRAKAINVILCGCRLTHIWYWRICFSQVLSRIGQLVYAWDTLAHLRKLSIVSCGSNVLGDRGLQSSSMCPEPADSTSNML